MIRLVYAYVAYRLGDGPMQTTQRVRRSSGRFGTVTLRSVKGELIAWLIGIARNCIADLVAAREQVVDNEPASETTTEDLEQSAVRRLTLRHAVERLDDRERELIALATGRSDRWQIGAVLGLRTNASRWHSIEPRTVARRARSRALARAQTQHLASRKVLTPFGVEPVKDK
jgi:hypothetical protein